MLFLVYKFPYEYYKKGIKKGILHFVSRLDDESYVFVEQANILKRTRKLPKCLYFLVVSLL